ncbi:MAG: NADH-quinone oxidoreductase subunit J [Anaerolineae bacterium]|nr:NADH-quinone oxidoreductase subunit J [Anaerolineae bacterium]
MTTDVLLFIIVGGIAVAAAIMMLLQENAVYSALFLIVNFGCVAFLYLMLDAPFLAMVQIAVYAGAIMVLFLFVIMLLGAEKLHAPTRQFRWLAPLALALAAGFLLVTGVAITQGQIDLTEPIQRPPMLRVVHAAPLAGVVDVYANGQLLAEDVSFGEATDFQGVPPGEYTIGLNPAGTDAPVFTTTITLAGNGEKTINAYSAVAYGGADSGPLTVGLIQDNLETTEARTARVSVLNTSDQAVNLVDFGSDFDAADDRVVLGNVEPGALVDLPPLAEKTSLRNWAFTGVDEAQTDLTKLPVLFRLNNPELFSIERDTAQLLVVGSEGLFDGSVRSVVIPLVTKAVSGFGSPNAIGELLFTRYMLAFQLIAVLLLAAMIGAIVLTHKEGAVARRRDVRRRVVKPLATAIGSQVGHDVLASVEDAPKLPEQQPSGD